MLYGLRGQEKRGERLYCISALRKCMTGIVSKESLHNLHGCSIIQKTAGAGLA